MKRKARVLRVLALSILTSAVVFAQDIYPDWVKPPPYIPPELFDALRESGLDSTFDISFHLDPFYLRGDFNGDNSPDYAVLVSRTSNGKIGIAFVLGLSGKINVCGGGNPLGNGGDDFKWMDDWSVFPKGATLQGATTLPPPVLKGDALLVKKLEAASGLIYWTGKTYEWYQQGD